MVSFAPRPLYLRYPLSWRPVGSQRLSGLGCSGSRTTNPRSFSPPSVQYIAYASVDEGVPVSSHLRERGHWGDQDVDGRIILRWIFRKLEGVVGIGWSWLGLGTGGGHLWVR